MQRQSSGGETSKRLICMDCICTGVCVPSNIFHYNVPKKCAMCLGMDKRVEPEINVRKFGPGRSRCPGMII